MDTVAGAEYQRNQSDATFSVGMEAELRFMRRFSVKSKAGLSVEKCLAALGGETRNRRMRAACKAMHAQVAGDMPLSRAMRGQPVFDATVVRLVEFGEQTQNLKGALANVADYMERVGRLRRAMHNAVARPLNVLSLVLLAVFIAAVVLSFLVKEVLPEVNASHHAMLSFADGIAIKVAEVVRVGWPYVGVLGFLSFLALHLLPRHPKSRAGLDQLALKMPLVSAATRATAQACFVRTVGILMRTGALLGEAMAISAITAIHPFMRNALATTVRKIESGKPYIEALVEDGFLRRRDVNAVQAAERRGELGMVMLTLADDWEREASDKVGRLTTLAHTAVVVLIGLAIAAVVLSLYVPVFISH
ncbi:MAG TPA: type II secretion system F family protein [Polyangia bacterium]